MSVVAAILAGGRSTRFGQDKTLANLGGRPLWRWSFDTYRAHSAVDRVVVVAGESNIDNIRAVTPDVCLGGETRQQSSLRALERAGDAEVLLVHDAARPFVSARLIGEVVHGVECHGAAAAGLPVTDTIKQTRSDGIHTLDRQTLISMQTPQGARVDLLHKAHALAKGDETDDMALLEAIGIEPMIVEGDTNNFKVTTPEDWARAQAMLGDPEQRVGFGYDVHPFCDEAGRVLILGGVAFPGHRPLHGHSDADVVLHAATDALLGAAALGDIGVHFPNSDSAWKNASSLEFLRTSAEMVKSEGWSIVNLDLTVIAETPKLMPHAMEIRSAVAQALGVEVSRISVKATTNEGLGFIGRGEGIAAHAVATIRACRSGLA